MKSVRLRLTLWYTFVLAVMLLAFSIIVFFLLSSNLNRQLDDEIKLRAAHLSVILVSSETPGSFIIDTSDAQSFQVEQDESAQIFNSDAAPLLSLGLQIDASLTRAVVLSALQGKNGYFTTETTFNQTIRVYSAPIINESAIIGVVLMGRTTDNVIVALDSYKNMAFISLLLITALAGGGGYFITSLALKPVRLIANTAREIGEGDLNRRIEVTDANEIGTLAQTLNNMFDKLQSAFMRERRFTSDASHELRTPLSIIEAQATLSLEKTRSKDEYKKALGLIAQETTHMSAIINDLLFLARSDSGKVKFELEPINLGDFIKDLAADVSVLTRKKHQKLELKRIENPVVQGDEIRLRQLFLNILENAIRYTESKGIITLSVTTEATMAKIRITDTGIGITKADIEHIFEPFFRADQGRARFEGGTGLGLAIGQKIAIAHGGKIEVESQEGKKGTSFSVFLPINPADQPAGQPRVARGVGKPGAISSRMHKLLFGR